MTFFEALNKVLKRFSTHQAVEQNTQYVIEFSPTSTEISNCYQKVVCEVVTGTRGEIAFTEWYALYRERNLCDGWGYFRKPLNDFSFATVCRLLSTKDTEWEVEVFRGKLATVTLD